MVWFRYPVRVSYPVRVMVNALAAMASMVGGVYVMLYVCCMLSGGGGKGRG